MIIICLKTNHGLNGFNGLISAISALSAGHKKERIWKK
jgi:hypothetical protein